MFTFSLKYKSRQLNKVANALSCQVIFLASVKSEIIGFKYLKDLDAYDEDFKEEWKSYTLEASSKYQIYDGFLFFGDHLYIL